MIKDSTLEDFVRSTKVLESLFTTLLGGCMWRGLTMCCKVFKHMVLLNYMLGKTLFDTRTLIGGF